MSTSPVCAVIGVGPGNGAAFARAFSANGANVALLSRNLDYLTELAAGVERCHAYEYDATDANDATDVLGQVAADLGPVDTLIYNAGNGVFGNIEDVSLEAIEEAFRINVVGLAAASKTLIPSMSERGHGNIIVVGATAALRGGANFSAFAAAKGGQRNLAQSMARLLGPRGIHVAYLVIDGIIDTPRVRERMGDLPAESLLQADDIARAALMLTEQPRSAWSFEIDLRPFGEKW